MHGPHATAAMRTRRGLPHGRHIDARESVAAHRYQPRMRGQAATIARLPERTTS